MNPEALGDSDRVVSITPFPDNRLNRNVLFYDSLAVPCHASSLSALDHVAGQCFRSSSKFAFVFYGFESGPCRRILRSVRQGSETKCNSYVQRVLRPDPSHASGSANFGDPSALHCNGQIRLRASGMSVLDVPSASRARLTTRIRCIDEWSCMLLMPASKLDCSIAMSVHRSPC